MRSFRTSLALRMAGGSLLLFVAVGAASVLALRSILYRQLDDTLLHLAEVEAQSGAAASGSDFQFHEGILLAARNAPATELIRYAQLWTEAGEPVVRSHNLDEDLVLPPQALAAARNGAVGWATHSWRGLRIRSVVYPLRLIGAAHHVHLLQVAAPTAPLTQTIARFAGLSAALTGLATIGAYLLGRRIAALALRPTAEITGRAEAISAGTLSERITAHADVEEFGRLVSVLNRMLDRLDGAFRIQQQFTADASHELRAPLTVLKGDIDVTLKRDRAPEEYRETLVRCREEVERLAKLADDLLVLARSDTAMPLEHVVEVDLRALLDRTVERFRAVAAARALTLRLSGDSAVVLGDDAILEGVVGNLIDNAVKYARPGGNVQADLSADAEAVTLTVQNDGPGIPPDDVPRLFSRFFRGDPARQRGQGTGLGLAIARAGAEVHGGRLEYVGNASGAVFRLTLPGRPASPPPR